MTEHISTEEAERIAAAQEHSVRSGRKPTAWLRLDTAAALRSLAAERDRLGNEVEHHVEELDLRMKAIREQEKRMAALAAERDALRRFLDDDTDPLGDDEIHDLRGGEAMRPLEDVWADHDAMPFQTTKEYMLIDELVIEALCAGDPDQHGGPYQRRHFDVEWHPLVSTAAGAQRDLAAALAKLRDTLRRNR